MDMLFVLFRVFVRCDLFLVLVPVAPSEPNCTLENSQDYDVAINMYARVCPNVSGLSR
jgi:hypothetical protein